MSHRMSMRKRTRQGFTWPGILDEVALLQRADALRRSGVRMPAAWPPRGLDSRPDYLRGIAAARALGISHGKVWTVVRNPPGGRPTLAADESSKVVPPPEDGE